LILFLLNNSDTLKKIKKIHQDLIFQSTFLGGRSKYYGRHLLPKMTSMIAAQHSLLDAVGLNNEAVSMIAAGDASNQKAIQLLRRSVSIIQKTSAAVQQCSGQVYKMPLASSATPDIHQHHESVSLHPMPDQRWFLYNKALRFNTSFFPLVSFREDYHIFSAVVVFNLALIYHRSALCGTQNFASLSLRASSLYSLALKLVDRHDWRSCSRSLTSTIVKLAAMNNLAQLSGESGDTKLAQDFLLHLTEAIRQSRILASDLFQASGGMGELITNLLLWQEDTVARAA
jgi:hypothetical protein